MIILQILIIVALFTLVVGAHEFGHYLFARWRGMDVEEFCFLGLPFGRKIVLGQTKSGTKVVIHPFCPLGGFVRIKGSEPAADGSETRIPNGFYSRGLGSRALVLFAGPLFSFLFGWLLFFGDAAAFGWQNSPYIGTVEVGSPAEEAGIEPGDMILKVDGTEVNSFTDVAAPIQAAEGKPVTVEYVRDRNLVTVNIAAEFKAPTLTEEIKNNPVYKESKELQAEYKKKKWFVGIGSEDAHPVGILGAASVASQQTWRVIAETGKILGSPGRLAKEAGGVISIGKLAGQAVDHGLSYFLALSALISVSLGIINLLPIPLMDGGQLMVVFLEWLRGGRRLSMKTQEALGFVGILIIAALFFTVTYLDIGRLVRG
ncbi:MAG: M50 family metallopeptidase [Armatimonadota bacterium]|nr:M50 family metallopeptidase [Armatimonadota bacterium]